ncbi:MAG: type II toxin-antitoxin system RelE/ParE family toxin [Gammaproteobacteria bacterium]|nr:type II toxin-antitoxin system RelE/ParE family toxin [Gammaproteobacteria bacterium]
MYKNTQKLEVRFFCSEVGSEPVREWLRELPKEDKYTIGADIKTIQYGWPLGMPLVDSLGKGLWEVRSKLARGRIARVIFFLDTGVMILVNGFIKKTPKTPQAQLDLSLKRKRLYETSRGA